MSRLAQRNCVACIQNYLVEEGKSIFTEKQYFLSSDYNLFCFVALWITFCVFSTKVSTHLLRNTELYYIFSSTSISCVLHIWEIHQCLIGENIQIKNRIHFISMKIICNRSLRRKNTDTLNICIFKMPNCSMKICLIQVSIHIITALRKK